MTKKWTSLLLLTPNTSVFVATLSPLHCSQQHHHRRQHQHPLPFSTMTTTTTTTSSVECNISSSSCTDRSGGGSDDEVITPATTNTKTTRKSKRLYSFQEARRIARGHGFDSYEEFVEYTCPGAYQIPKDANIVWKEEWRGWDDFLGLPLSFPEARIIARSLSGISSEESYLELMKNKSSSISDDDIASRLPYRPDLKYKTEWMSWDDFLNSTT
ncbi:hypothetical protein ACHAWU_002765 [Discostella pseudostelligera]|uniref:Uncharacterized protein n=1 Tax=Discostella pseudostelligera TaxID=259834 RepID=A0ABD3MZZ6_9STRA